MSILASAQSPPALLAALKDLKNSVIGNTWKKVEVAEDVGVMQLLMSQLDRSISISGERGAADDVSREIVQETAVIVGALSTVGPLTIQPLLRAHASERLFALIRHTSLAGISGGGAKLVPHLLRALRNVQVSIADVVWGHMWGVGFEQKVIGTGLVGVDLDDHEDLEGSKGSVTRDKGKGKAKANDLDSNGSWKIEARRALGLVFEEDNLDAIISLIQPRGPFPADQQLLLPLYQLLARLVALPSHRRSLAKRTSSRASASTTSERSALRADTAPEGGEHAPVMLSHAMATINEASGNGNGPLQGRRNPKLLEAALELLAAMVKGEAGLAARVRDWPSSSGRSVLQDPAELVDEGEENAIPGFLGDLVQMMTNSGTGVRIAAANCLTNVLKADKNGRTSDRIRARVIKMQLLDILYKLLETETYEERVKLCFVLAALVSDDAQLQFSAAAKGCPTQLLDMIAKVEQDELSGEIGLDTLSRHREGILLALAALSFQHEPTRVLIAEREPSIFPFIITSLQHASYGVRAAACQLARALSRTVAILRTSLVDSGVGEEVIRTLRREALYQDMPVRDASTGRLHFSELAEQEELEQHGLVEVAALATICNLITDFSPLRAKLVSAGYLDLICLLTASPSESIAVNALWAIKNLLFHSTETLKAQVMASLTVETLRELLDAGFIPPAVRAQTLCVVQNLFADATSSESVRWLDMIGESYLMDALQTATKSGDTDQAMPAMYILSNLGLGNERVRQCIMSRVELLEALSQAIDHRIVGIQIPALRAIHHLLESTTRTRKPRQAVVEAFQPYQLKARLNDLADHANDFDVRHDAKAVLDVLERGTGRESVGPSGR